MDKKIIEFIQSDYYRYTGKLLTFSRLTFYALIARNHCFAYSYWMRLALQRNLWGWIAKLMHYRLSRKYGIQISPKCKIGYGLYIGHGVGIIINQGTTIGNNCNISQFLSIGTNHNTPAVIGDNVYIGPHVSIVEDVHIGRNVTIGAGSVVIKDIPDDSTAVGVPAKVIGKNNHPEYIMNKFKWE